ncbi:MAG TPA: uracil-DNA glycosylase, partial [Aggregatilineales bacterium]|nr:uracil-DNA glycosylase [Aggregatilineales bacterium]
MPDSLEQIAAEVAVCTRCPLHRGRTKAVPGEGSPNADIMFIGEGPGYHEDRQGRPFVGASGSFLTEMLEGIGLRREDVFIANVVKCRPPGNRDPEPHEIQACSAYLDRQIALIDPKVIVTLGRFSMAKWFPTARISRIHGQARKINGRLIVPFFHPAAALERHHQHGGACRAHRANRVHKGVDRGGVEAGGGLVEHQQVWLAHQGARDQ